MILCLYFSCSIHVFPALSFLQIYNKKKPLSSTLLKKQKKALPSAGNAFHYIVIMTYKEELIA